MPFCPKRAKIEFIKARGIRVSARAGKSNDVCIYTCIYKSWNRVSHNHAITITQTSAI